MLIAEGHRVFSIGHHFDPFALSGDLRPLLPGALDHQLFNEFHLTGCDLAQKKITKAFIRHFDIVVIMHDPILLLRNLDAFGDIPIVIRTIGQSDLSLEDTYRRLGNRIKIVRYSDRETALAGFAKTDAVIYFGKYGTDFLPWNGGNAGITFHNSYDFRDHSTVPALEMWKQFGAATGSELWGVGNGRVAASRGKAATDQMRTLLSKASWYFYIYTFPPSYTLSLIEAMLAGVPVIAPSLPLVESIYPDTMYGSLRAWSSPRYEVEEIVGDGGLFYNSIEQAIEIAGLLRSDPEYGRSLSNAARANALARFDAETIAPRWSRFLNSIL
ncbi:hypothetical protein [Rhodopseudomonas sp. BAL398]|nr:hypothetical protein [Rhodopseudomonas sp. BAL398]